MLAKVNSFGLDGINGYPIVVETDVHNGLPSFETVGLPDATIKESRERVRSAIKNSGFQYPPNRITVNLAPADTKKEGTFFDLPIAISLLAATEQLPYTKTKEYCFLGELGLDGNLRRINGILPILISAYQKGIKKFIIPKGNLNEARFVEGIQIFGVESLSQTVDFLVGQIQLDAIEVANISNYLVNSNGEGDFKFIKGQHLAKRALEVAAAGGHNVLLIGPPGAGKTMLARALPTILPDLTPSEALETTKIHSIAGLVDSDIGLVTSRPFRTPHHSVTMVSLTGGGHSAKPGEISFAHNGVLYLDELPEYNKHVLESLRQPLEDSKITISRNTRTVQYPANIMLIASMNPCPCGYYGSKTVECKCSASSIKRYLSKLSGPLLDRIDIYVEVDNVEFDDINSKDFAEPSCSIKERVNKARQIQLQRYQKSNHYCNAKMNSEDISNYCQLTANCQDLLKIAFNKLNLTARSYNRILKVARTIADLDGSELITINHLSEAIQYKSVDKKYNL